MTTTSLLPFLYAFVLPALLVGAGLAVEFVDRKLYARLQNRRGPPWFQPLADNLKLFTKAEIVPVDADATLFRWAPAVGLAAAMCAFLYVPVWSPQALLSFTGDSVVVLYLLTIPTLCMFVGGWFSGSLYAGIGSMRTLTSLFAYEVPLFMAILAPAVLAGSWSLSEVAGFYQDRPALALVNLPALAVALVALLGKLEKAPFDIPEAETELAGGTLVEYSGKLLALFRVTLDVEAVVASSLLAAVFLPWGMALPAPVALALYVVKVLLVSALLALGRTIFARLRIDQMVTFCWRWVAPVALLQLLLNVILNGVMPS
jgi:NADH-quinone oxidoreductase subunit H